MVFLTIYDCPSIITIINIFKMDENITINNQSSKERIFYSLLVRVGALGKYQYVCLLIWGVLYMVSSSSVFCIPFLFYQPPYVCSDLQQKQCLAHVCSLPYQLRPAFALGLKETLINKFGDFRCEELGQVSMFQSIIYFSATMGIIIGAYLNTYLRKKLLVQATLLISILCLIGTLFATNLILLITLLCLNQALQSIIGQLLLCFIPEEVLQSQRRKHTMLLFLFYNAGSFSNSLLFKVFDWQKVLVFYFILLFVLTFIGLKLYIKQTPFDLINYFEPEEALQTLNWIAKENGTIQTHMITISQLRNIKYQYQMHMEQKQQKQFGVWDLFRYKSLRMDVIYCFFIHFFIFFNYCAPVLALNQFSTDIYPNGMIFSSATMLSAIVCYFFIQDLQRKKMVNYTTFLSLIFIIPLCLKTKCDSNCSSANKWIETICIFIFRMVLEITYQAYYFIQNEIFPTQIRVLAILLTGGASTISKIFVPIVANLNQQTQFALPFSFIASGILIILLMSQVEQTVGVPPPEMIKQLAYKHQDID